MEHTHYQYRPLLNPDSIRLISADLAINNGILSCQLVEVDVDSKKSPPPYHTLSYTWGNPHSVAKDVPNSELDILKQPTRITVSGPPSSMDAWPSGSLWITKNLHDFLQEFCRNPPSDVQYIWVDSICISQTDLDERNAQVRMMSKTFANCESVIVWLGLDDPDTPTPFIEMETLNNFADDDFDARMKLASAGPEKIYANTSSIFHYLEISPFTDEQWEGLALFLDRSWFHRVWTIQESLLPSNGVLWCGEFRTPIKGFLDRSLMVLDTYLAERGISALKHPENHYKEYSHKIYSSAFKDRISAIRSRTSKTFLRGKLHSIHVATRMSRSRQCSDPRDKIFAILGLSTFDWPVDDIDYKKSVQDVFLEFSSKSSLGPLLYSIEDPSTRVTMGLPSWVPDYCVDLYPVSWMTRGGSIYSAGIQGECPLRRLDSQDNKILAVSGFVVDTVDAIGADYDEMTKGGGLLDSLELLEEKLDNGSTYEDIIEAFWRTLIADLPGNSNRHPSSKVYGPSFRSASLHLIAAQILKAEISGSQLLSVKSLLESLLAKSKSHDLPTWDDVSNLVSLLSSDKTQGNILDTTLGDMDIYLNSLRAMFICRRFFTTSKGLLGIGSVVVLPGDKVVILEGSGYPFLLRATSDGRYRLIGHAHVRGIMYGEALGTKEFQRIEIE
ncbi:unnamed protein product [Clonostachys solani]|uniref:Heterokaryon incompatibility domain-containing protein n=1 Tax=Clonostachys solani TaxID=160281 RepID=A0A9N9ZBH7_9HYPO|nr:unnamed protein product [Clonostachys solani]